MDALMSIIIAIVFIVGIGSIIYDHTSHSMVRGFTLREDASITNIKTDTVGGRKITTAAIRTTVIFDDGFTYISHKSRYHKDDPLNFRGTLYVNHEVIQEIKEDAIIAHQKAYEKQQGRY